MQQKDLRALLEQVSTGSLSIEDAMTQFKTEPFQDLGFAKVDHHRALRQGVAEVIYGAGKTPEQIISIARAMLDHGQKTILITRLEQSAAEFIAAELPLTYHTLGRVGIIGDLPNPDGAGQVIIATGGTSDMPVAEEAALTAEALGNEVLRLYDVGVAGLHRLLAHGKELANARVVVVFRAAIAIS